MKILTAALFFLSGQVDQEYVKAVEKKIQKFQKALDAGLEDPEAFEAVGRFHCFVRGDWTTGLPLLSKGKDAHLRELAEVELGKDLDRGPKSPLTGATVDFGEDLAPDVVRGDSWWSVASKEKGPLEKRNIFNRATHWYRIAVGKVSDPKIRKKLYSRIDAHARVIGPITVRVPAASAWTDSGIEFVEGQRIKISSTGTWCLDANKDKGAWCKMDGYKGMNASKAPFPDGPMMCLLGRIGDGKMFAVTKDNPHAVEANGRLFLGPNDFFVDDNQGELVITVEISM